METSVQEETRPAFFEQLEPFWEEIKEKFGEWIADHNGTARKTFGRRGDVLAKEVNGLMGLIDNADIQNIVQDLAYDDKCQVYFRLSRERDAQKKAKGKDKADGKGKGKNKGKGNEAPAPTVHQDEPEHPSSQQSAARGERAARRRQRASQEEESAEPSSSGPGTSGRAAKRPRHE